MSLPKNLFLLPAPPPPNPDWLEDLLNQSWNSTARLQVDRYLDYLAREFEIGEAGK